MKLVDVSEFYAEQGGGVRTYTHQKLAAGARLGVEVVVVAPGDADREEPRLGGRIVWVKSPRMPFDPRYHVLLRERAVHDILEREAPDVVEGSSPWTAGHFVARWRNPGRYARKALVFHQDPVAVYPHTFLDCVCAPATLDRLASPYWGWLRRLSQAYDHTVVAGEWLAARLATHHVARPVAVPFGIDKPRARLATDPAHRKALLSACGASPDGALLVAISRHHPEKRLGTVLAGFARAARRAGTDAAGRPRLGLVLYGDGPLRPFVDARAAGTPGVHVAGFLRDRTLLARALASADALVHGSAAETYGLVVAEALCAGIPLVVPSRGGAADLADPAWAETYEPGNARALAHAIHRLLTRDRDALRRAATAAGRDRVRDQRDHFAALFALYEGGQARARSSMSARQSAAT